MRKVIQFIRENRHCWLTLYFVIFVCAFFILEKNTVTEGYWVTDLPIDEKIPFIPQFIFFYVLWYPLFAAVGIPLLIGDAPAFKRYMYFNMLGLTASLVFCFFVPNGQNLRPADMQVGSLSTWFLSGIYAADTNTNVFPSMHVLGCIGNILAVFDSGIFKKWRAVIVVVSVLVSVSTVFVKQHALIDCAGAAACAIPLFFIVYGRRFLKKSGRL